MATLVVARNSTIVRNIRFALLRAGFAFGSWLRPAATLRRAYRLFCTPLSVTRRRALATDTGGAALGSLAIGGEQVSLYTWGDPSTQPYVRERKQFNAPIGTFGLMQGKIADMYTALQSSRAYAYLVAQNYDQGIKSRIDPASCLLHASQSAVQVALEAIQALGGNGYINEYPAGRILRDAKLYEIGAGTNEIRRMLIGRELFHGKS